MVEKIGNQYDNKIIIQKLYESLLVTDKDFYIDIGKTFLDTIENSNTININLLVVEVGRNPNLLFYILTVLPIVSKTDITYRSKIKKVLKYFDNFDIILDVDRVILLKILSVMEEDLNSLFNGEFISLFDFHKTEYFDYFEPINHLAFNVHTDRDEYREDVIRHIKDSDISVNITNVYKEVDNIFEYEDDYHCFKQHAEFDLNYPESEYRIIMEMMAYMSYMDMIQYYIENENYDMFKEHICEFLIDYSIYNINLNLCYKFKGEYKFEGEYKC